MKHVQHPSWLLHATSAVAAILALPILPSLAAPAGPEPQIPDGGAAPGAFPNTSVTGVNVIAKGSSSFTSAVEVTGLDGNGPIPWTVNRYNRGDIAIRLSPGDPAAAAGSLNQGFTELGDNSPGLAASQAWRPSPLFGVVIPTARQNGPVDWGDGEGPLFPTIAVSESSSGPGYDMASGAFGAGNLDINTGRAGTHSSSPEATFAFSATWFPYDQGWLAGEAAGPYVGNADIPDGTPRWTQPNAHATGLTAGLIRWPELSEGSGTYGGRAELALPGVNSLEDGMLFATSSDGGSDVNIVGVAPKDDGNGWLVTVREDSAVDSETLASADQSEFQFVYLPFDAQRLIGGHITGSSGAKRKATGDFTVSRTGAGTYELTLPGKTGSSGALILQAADLESGTSVPLATRAFLSYEFKDGKFVVQSRVTTGDTTSELRDTSFYVAWIDFTSPLAPPDGPRLRSIAPVAVSGEGVKAREAAVAAHTTVAEVLVTTVDTENPAGWVDPITGQTAVSAIVGRFHDARTLAPTSDPFIILGNPSGQFTRHDVKFNPVSKQYVVVANARTYGDASKAVPLVALVKSAADAGAGSPVAKAFAYRGDTEIDFDDVAVAVSTKNGNFILLAEYKFVDEGEGSVAAIFNSAGTLLTPELQRVDLLQSVGDEDDPDVTYLEGKDVFLYVSNTDNSNGSTGTLGNRIVGSIIETTPDSQGKLVTRPEQPLADGLPAGTREGHPASILNPFNGELITAYDVGGDNVAAGDLSFFDIGAAPSYTFTSARPEIPYLAGTGGNPFRHQHPQLAADTKHGVIVVGHQASGSDLGYRDAYVFTLLGPDGQPLPSQLGTPYFLADAPAGIAGSANYHNVIYSPVAEMFLVTFVSGNPGTTFLAGLSVTSNHLAPVAAPNLSIARAGTTLEVSWPSSAAGYQLQGSAALGSAAAWSNVAGTPVAADNLWKMTVTPSASAQFYRLAKP